MAISLNSVADWDMVGCWDMLELLSLDFDRRISAFCITAKATYGWFLDKTAGAEENLEIQRKIIKGTKAYATLRQDLKKGCILPPLVLSIKNVDVPQEFYSNPDAVIDSRERVSDFFGSIYDGILDTTPDDIFIIDGLQRTNALRQVREGLSEEELAPFNGTKIRFELWLDIPFGAIAYRMLLLNAGQKPMSMKHQVEILSRHLKDDLADIDDLDVFAVADGRRRTKSGQFQLAKITQAFQAWLQGSPNVDVSNVVMQELLAESAIDTLGSSISAERRTKQGDSFKALMEWIVAIDCLLPEDLDFLGAETVLQGIAAAVGAAERNPSLRQRVKTALPALLDDMKAFPDQDLLGVQTYKQLRKGFDPAKRNVGVATRELVFQAFQEYFLSSGAKSMEDCWKFAATVSKA